MSRFPRRFAFFAYAYNLAETTRAVEVARALRDRGAEIHFFTHGGLHEPRIVEADFPITTLPPLITPEKHAYLLDLDQGHRIGQPFTVNELHAQVKTELAALRALLPVVVYAGMNLPADFNFTQAVHAADERIPVAAPLWELASIEKNNK